MIRVQEYFPGFVDPGETPRHTMVNSVPEAMLVPWILEKAARVGDKLTCDGQVIKGPGGFVLALLLTEDGRKYWDEI